VYAFVAAVIDTPHCVPVAFGTSTIRLPPESAKYQFDP